jgi:hypothetical protein
LSSPDHVPAGTEELQHQVPASATSLLDCRQSPGAEHLPFARILIAIAPAAEMDGIDIEKAERGGNPGGEFGLALDDAH